MNKIVLGDNIEVLKSLAAESIDLIYIDPPFNTGKTQVRHRISTVRDEDGDRTGFGGKRYVSNFLWNGVGEPSNSSRSEMSHLSMFFASVFTPPVFTDGLFLEVN